MTRKEEIRQYLKERNIPITSLEANSIIEGIEWADEHPKQGLISINKACEWLKDELFEDVAEPNPYYYSDVKSKTYNFLENFIEGFRKAMEE